MQATKAHVAVPSAPEAATREEPGLDHHDAAAGALGLFAAAIVWATLTDQGWLMLGSYRGAIAVLGLIGLGMCAVGARITPGGRVGPFLATAYTMGGAAGFLLVTGLISPSKQIFLALAIDMALLWLVATTRHALGRS